MNFKIITPGQPEYEEWNNRGVNLRFSGRPSEIIPVTTTEELTNALQYSIDKNYRIAIRGGGHCLENFVSNPDINIIIDISAMKGIRYDPNWNKSGLPWHAFYYQDNYPRLQKIKATWDPLNIFSHSLSVEPNHTNT